MIRVLFLVLMLMSQPILASEKMLKRFFQEVSSMQARFEQTVVDETGLTLQHSRGTLLLARPGRFRWDYQSDDPELDFGQQVIADGESIYMYDPDLEQVTQRSMRDALIQVPSLVLVDGDGQLENHFVLTDIGLTDGLSWVALKPISADASYQQLMLGFSEGVMYRIVLLDGLGNETTLRLFGVKENVAFAEDAFDFTPPDGTDVLAQ